MRTPTRARLDALTTAAALALTGTSAAEAQNQQEGLVNVAIEDVIVQAPIALAANVCDVNVAVLAEVADDAAACEATADSTATAGPNSGGNTRQSGLVNVLIDDVLVQLPISVAANVCDVNVAVLARVVDDASACEATADAVAQPGSGGGGAANPAGTIVQLPIDISLLDNNTADDGGAGDIVGTGTPLVPLPAGLTPLS